MWLAEHRLVFCGLLIWLGGLLGYLGALGRMSPQPFAPGLPGLLHGLAGSTVILAVIWAWTKLRGTRSS
jgi:hypothetical protein